MGPLSTMFLLNSIHWAGTRLLPNGADRRYSLPGLESVGEAAGFRREVASVLVEELGIERRSEEGFRAGGGVGGRPRRAVRGEIEVACGAVLKDLSK
jgi:hypothetical protein